MAYIGKNPTTGSFIYADDITTSSTNTYNILVGGVAFSPESANHCIVSLNGVIQKANTSFSISGSQITFLPSSGTLSSSDSIDFLLILGSVNDVGVATTVSDQAITKAKTNFVSSGSGYTGTGLDIKGDGSANGRLGLLCSAGSHGVALESPDHSSAQSYTIQLPSNSPTVDKVIKVTSLTGSGATAIAHTQFGDAGGTQTPFFYGEKASDLDLSRSVTTQVTGFTTEEIDTDSAFDGTTFTVPSGQAGKYYLEFGATINFSDEGGDGELFIAYIYKNGSSVKTAISGVKASSGQNINQETVICNVVLNLSVGDTITYYAHGVDANGGGGGTIDDDISHVMGYKLIGV